MSELDRLKARRDELMALSTDDPAETANRDQLVAQIDTLLARAEPGKKRMKRAAAPAAPRKLSPSRSFALTAIPLQRGTELQVSVATWGERRKVDVRTWFKAQDGALLPTRKGFAVTADQLDALIEALQQGRQHLAGPT